MCLSGTESVTEALPLKAALQEQTGCRCHCRWLSLVVVVVVDVKGEAARTAAPDTHSDSGDQFNHHSIRVCRGPDCTLQSDCQLLKVDIAPHSATPFAKNNQSLGALD